MASTSNSNGTSSTSMQPPMQTPAPRLAAFMAKPSAVSDFVLGDWQIRTLKDRIMESSCSHTHFNPTCDVCIFNRDCPLPVLPEMIFAKNYFQMLHRSSGCKITFKCLSALMAVDAKKSDSDIKVSATADWLSTRKDVMQSMNKQNALDYDWTYSTTYRGDATGFNISPTDERIDLEQLKVREQILYYEELPLFEDEIGDHGCAMLSLRARCMPSGLFVLLRYYLRVDHVMVRLYDTRVRWCKQRPNVVLREWTHRQLKWTDMNTELRENVMKPDVIWQQLPVVHEDCELLQIPTAGDR